MRGNPDNPVLRVRDAGSIPAPAGEPVRRPHLETVLRVYPSACGGTSTSNALASFVNGLSPRLRGNLLFRSRGQWECGSIPAPAGEPLSGNGRTTTSTVYPRACWGTANNRFTIAATAGLSPRLRGNPGALDAHAVDRGSIPAHAGEPWTSSTPAAWSTVYPRACGGTGAWYAQTDHLNGLSPRMRGNHGRIDYNERRKRSIPAHAGEPKRESAAPCSDWVYPRACGGTTPSASLPT